MFLLVFQLGFDCYEIVYCVVFKGWFDIDDIVIGWDDCVYQVFGLILFGVCIIDQIVVGIDIDCIQFCDGYVCLEG